MPRRSLPEPTSRTLEECARSWRLALADEHKSPRTIRLYGIEVAKFIKSLEDDMTVALVTPDHIRAYMASLQERGLADTTRSISFRSVQALFTWCVEEGELEVSPFARLHAPKIDPEKDRNFPVPSDGELDRVLAGIAKDQDKYRKARDTAILLVLMDTGVRLGELASIQLDDVDLDTRVAHVTGKTGWRAVRFSARCARACDRYMQVRSRHFARDHKALWLARAGAMSESGLYQVVKDRGDAVGVRLHPHQLRHRFASKWLAAGGAEVDLQHLAGWRSGAMVRRYSAHDQSARALSAYDRVLAGE